MYRLPPRGHAVCDDMPVPCTKIRCVFPPPNDSDEHAPEEWTKHELLQTYLADRLENSSAPLVVQFGSEQCILCPKATLDLDAAIKTHHFVWKHENVFTSSLAEELEVTALPALLVFRDPFNYAVYQKLRNDDVMEVVREHCQPRLVLDEEF